MGTDRFPFPQRSYTHILIALFCSQTHSRSFPRYLESITSMMFRLTPQDDKTSETPRTRSTGPMVLVTSFLRQAGVPPMDSKTWASGSPARSGTPLYRSTAMTVRSQDRTEEMLTRPRLTTKTVESRGRILDHLHTRQHGGWRVTCVLLISFLLMSQLSQVAGSGGPKQSKMTKCFAMLANALGSDWLSEEAATATNGRAIPEVVHDNLTENDTSLAGIDAMWRANKTIRSCTGNATRGIICIAGAGVAYTNGPDSADPKVVSTALVSHFAFCEEGCKEFCNASSSTLCPTMEEMRKRYASVLTKIFTNIPDDDDYAFYQAVFHLTENSSYSSYLTGN